MRCVFRHFEAAIGEQRGCIALLRLLTTTSCSSRAVDKFLERTVANLPQMVNDAHGNYIVSNLLCNYDERDVDKLAAKQGLQSLRNAAAELHYFEPVAHAEMVGRTSKILALTARPSGNRGGTPGATAAPLPPVPPQPQTTIAVATPGSWRAFVTAVATYLAENPNAYLSNRTGCHVLENALRRLPYDRVPATRVLPQKLLADLPGTLAPMCHSPWGHHGVQALMDTLSARPLLLGGEICQLARTQFTALLTTQRTLLQSSPYTDKLDTLMQRLVSQLPRAA